MNQAKKIKLNYQKIWKAKQTKNAIIIGIIIFTFFFICAKGFVLGGILANEHNLKFSEVLTDVLEDGLFYLFSIIVYTIYYLNFEKRNSSVTTKLVITAIIILIILVISLCI